MNASTTPTDHDRARDRIETAWRDHPFCRGCGQPMTIEVKDGCLWIECFSLRSLSGIRLRLGASLHDRFGIDLPDETMIQAAA